MPVIAVARCSRLLDYEASVNLAGGTPWIVDQSTAHPEDVMGVANGLLLTGGSAVRADLQDAAARQVSSAAETGRDAYEIELVSLALEADLPLLAICRGILVLNVARGGTLVHDIPTDVPDSLEHRLAVPPYEPFTFAHDIWIEERSLLATLTRDRFTGADGYRVNSRHDQALKELGDRLVTTAAASDDVIEAVEDPTRRFCVGVQWHPENFYRTGEFGSLFEGFIRACTT